MDNCVGNIDKKKVVPFVDNEMTVAMLKSFLRSRSGCLSGQKSKCLEKKALEKSKICNAQLTIVSFWLPILVGLYFLKKYADAAMSKPLKDKRAEQGFSTAAGDKPLYSFPLDGWSLDCSSRPLAHLLSSVCHFDLERLYQARKMRSL